MEGTQVQTATQVEASTTCEFKPGMMLQRSMSGAASLTSCPETMAHGQACRAVCTADARVEGSITCVSGLLVGVSYCLSSDDMIAENVTKVVGELELEVASSVSANQLTAAIAEAFAVDQQNVFVFVESGSKRRLAAAPHRFLPSTFLVEYEVVVPMNRSKDQFVGTAKALTDEGSTVGRAFTGILETFGVKVFTVSVVQQAVLAEAVVIRDSEAKIIKFNAVTQAASTTSSGTNSGVNMEALGGVIAAFFFGLIVAIICCGCKKDCRSPKPEASSADSMSHSLSENRH